MSRMYIRIVGDDDQQGASYEINGSAFFLQQAIIGLFNSLVRFSHGNLMPALKCLEEITRIIEEETRGGDNDV